MGSKIDGRSDEAEKAVRDIRRATRRHFSAEDKIRIVIAGLRGEDSVDPDMQEVPGSIDTATGDLSLVGQFTSEAGAETRGLAIHPRNEFIYDPVRFPRNVVGVDIGDQSFSGIIFGRNSITPAIYGTTEIAIDPIGRMRVRH